MEDGPVTVDARERGAPLPVRHDVAIRESAPPASRQQDDMHSQHRANHHGHDDNRHAPGEVWSGAIMRMQTQISYNTSMLEAQRRQLSDCELAVSRLGQELGSVHQALDGLRAEMRSRPPPSEHPRHDAGDLDVLAEQVAHVTSKANEVDELKMQVKLMRNQLKRMEDQSASPALAMRPEPTGPPSRRPSGSHEMGSHPPPGQHRHGGLLHQGFSPHTHPHGHPHPHPHPHPPPPPPPASAQQHQLPPMRALGSPADSRPPSFNAPPPPLPPVPALHSQHSNEGLRGTPSDPRHTDMSKPPSAPPNFRPSEPLPPPSSLSGWRPADQFPAHHQGPPPPPGHPSAPHPPPPPPAMHGRPYGMEGEPQGAGWAAVNAGPPPKRPLDDVRPSPYGSPVSGSPKRPKLAPIMPRSMHGDESAYPPPGYGRGGPNDPHFRPENHPSSEVSRTPPQPHPGMLGDAQAYRFITSTGTANGPEGWRPEAERVLHVHQHHPGRGGRGGRRGGGRGRGRGRGGGGAHHAVHLAQRLGTPPARDRPEHFPHHGSPEGYYPLHPYSPKQGRNILARRSGGRPELEHDLPATPHMHGPGGPTEIGLTIDLAQPSSGSKKTRTKPVRNADGVLIRKDGRPDMRSVSSANNLRKVHAKKEADRGDGDGKSSPGAGGPEEAADVSDEGEEELSNESPESGGGEGNGAAESPGQQLRAPTGEDEETSGRAEHASDGEREHDMPDASDAKPNANGTILVNGSDRRSADVEMREGSTAPAPAAAPSTGSEPRDPDTNMSEELPPPPVPPPAREERTLNKRPRRGTNAQLVQGES